MKVLDGYRLTPPDGKPFDVAVVEGDDGFVHLWSKRGSKWEPEKTTTVADVDYPQ